MFSRFAFALLLVCAASFVRSEEPTENDGYSADELKVIENTREHHTFQTEVNKLMDILINSIYSSSEVFLRELISNAADALDKIRYKSISDPSQLDSNPNLEIRIKVDQEHRTITISDSGVGMTRQELIDNLGTIAQSGTTNFLNNLKNSEGAVDLGLIGQFGVGFYSAFLVADRVTVHSKSNDDAKQYIWDASSQREYQVYVDPKQDIGRGTTIVLHVKESTPEFLNEAKLKSLVKQYSEFIDFPIYVWVSHEEEVEAEAEEDTDLGEEIDIQDVEEGAKEEKKKVTVWGWERVNELKPLWYRKPADITEDEYFSFYKAVFHDTSDPIAHLHFNAEGDINFKSILFVPSSAPSNLYDLTEKKTDMKLYVKRVFITDDFSEIIPRYLSFIKGVVDSDDLPLNVNRELLQKNKLLKIMKKKLTRKAIAMIQDLAKDNEKYLAFWEQFGTSIKLGVMEDDSNKQRLEKLLRFHSSKTDGLTSFDDYITRMKEGQKDIYFFASQDEKANMMKSPLLEKLLKKDYEVLFMVDPIDEYLFQTGGLAKYEEKNIVNVAKENLDLGDDEEEDDEDVDKVCDYLKEILTGKISKCKVSSRLTDSPSALTSSQWGWTGNMEKLAKAQALGDKSMHKFYKGQKVLEINPKHPIIIELKNRLVAGADAATKEVAYLMYETALLSSGYELDDQPAFARRVQNVLRLSLGLEAVEEEVVETAETASTPEDGDDEMEL